MLFSTIFPGSFIPWLSMATRYLYSVLQTANWGNTLRTRGTPPLSLLPPPPPSSLHPSPFLYTAACTS